MTDGVVMLDVLGTELTAEDREILDHPAVGGVIFFTRNFESGKQIAALVKAIRRCTRNECVIAVDHEGGRVQRFQTDFTRLPPASLIGEAYVANKASGLAQAKELGWLMAAELRQVDIDISFAPVLDLAWGASTIIGNRAFSSDAASVVAIAQAYIAGMHEAGMAATGKHFPGHGAVAADSHLELPRDEREQAVIFQHDMRPFRELAKVMDAVMPAHVVYPAIDSKPAGFSPRWLREVLRADLQFDGVIFSDDLSMEGAAIAGSYGDRTMAALEAGCDVVLICNQRQAAYEVIDASSRFTGKTVALAQLRGRDGDFANLRQQPRWQQAAALVTQMALC